MKSKLLITIGVCLVLASTVLGVSGGAAAVQSLPQQENALLGGEGAYANWIEVGALSASGGGISNNTSSSDSSSIGIHQPSGWLYVAWSDDADGDEEVYVRHWNGSAWSELGSSASGGGISKNTGESANPSVAVAPGTGLPFVAWADYSNGNSEIYLRAWTTNSVWRDFGGSGSGGGISNTSEHSYDPSLALNADGMPCVTWEENATGNAEIYLKCWNGLSWSGLGNSGSGGGVSDTSTGSYAPSLAFAPNGTPYVAWHEDTAGLLAPGAGDYEIYIRRWNGSAWVEEGAGSASGDGISDSGGNASGASLAIAPDGTPYVAWNKYGTGNTEIYLKTFIAGIWQALGGSASGGGISNNALNSYSPSLAIDPDGTPYVAWYDASGGSGQDIYARRWNGSAWEEVGPGSGSGSAISSNSGDSCHPALAIAQGGIPYVAWDDGTETDTEIYIRRYPYHVFLPMVMKPAILR